MIAVLGGVCYLARAGHVVDLVVLLDTPIAGPFAVAIDDEDDSEALGRIVGNVKRRSRNALALTRMQSQRTWYHSASNPCRVRSRTR